MDFDNNVKMAVTASKAEATMVKEEKGAEQFKSAPWNHAKQETVDDKDDTPQWAEDWATEVWEKHSKKFPWWDTRQNRNMHSSPCRG